MPAEVPSWKRTLEDLLPVDEDAPPRKKQRPTIKSTVESLSTSNGGSSTSVSSSSTSSPSVVRTIGDTDSVSKLLAQLEGGLNYVSNMHGLSDDARYHASELRKLLYKEAAAQLVKTATEGEEKEKKKSSKHTNVPAPIPGIRVLSRTGSSSPDSPTSEWVLPPLPPITDLTLLNAPFTHSSVLPTYIPQNGNNTYEPLEFLGDAHLELIATKLIHRRFPMHSVGQKAGLREILVKNETLSRYSTDYGLASRIQIAGANAITAPKWTKILADVFEAYIACIVLSDKVNGATTAEEWLNELWEPKIQEWLKTAGKSNHLQEKQSHDVKGALQKYVISKGARLDYEEVAPMEFDRINNRTTYFIEVSLTGWGYNKVKLGTGTGRSKQLAGADAAKDAFKKSKDILDKAHNMKLAFDAQNLKKRII